MYVEREGSLRSAWPTVYRERVLVDLVQCSGTRGQGLMLFVAWLGPEICRGCPPVLFVGEAIHLSLTRRRSILHHHTGHRCGLLLSDMEMEGFCYAYVD